MPKISLPHCFIFNLPVNFRDRVERIDGVLYLARDAPLAAALFHRLLRQEVQFVLDAAVAVLVDAVALNPPVARGRRESGRMSEKGEED